MAEKKKSNIRLIKSDKNQEETQEEVSNDQKLLTYLDELKELIQENPNSINDLFITIFFDDSFKVIHTDEELTEMSLIGLLDILRQKIIDDI